MIGNRVYFSTRLVDWYRANRRELPWRVDRGTPSPYYVLVSEAMLQQTQVAAARPYFLRFIERFPTLAALASAEPQEVLRLWQGLGYYSRARNLHTTAQIVIAKYAGVIPSQVDLLMELPGIGRYTAGAIASLAFEQRAAVLDGNVIRVLCRVDAIQEDPRWPDVRKRLWQRAEQLLPDEGAGNFNSGLMELGATICTPRSAKCMLCPVQGHCQAFSAGMQDRIPAVQASKARPIERRWTLCVRCHGKWLIEQRPTNGRWAGMWQFLTIEAGRGRPTAQQIGKRTGVDVTTPQPLGRIKHDLTHRRYEFEVFVCQVSGHPVKRPADGTVWASLVDLSDYPLPRPHLRIADMLRQRSSTPKGQVR